MATYTTQAVITVETLETAERPEYVIAEAEQTVRITLARAGDAQNRDDQGDVRIGWLALIPGHTDPGRVRVLDRWEEWTPGDDLPKGATSLSCRGRRIV